MSDTATDLTPETPDAPPVEPQAQGDGDPAPLAIEDDAAVDAALEQSAIDVPDGDKLAPLSEVGKVARAYRAQVKELKGELASAQTSAAEAATLKQQIAALNAKVQELQPYVSAYQAMTTAAQQAAAPEDTAEAEEYARLMDLYTPDGKPDVARAQKAIAFHEKRAGQQADERVAPIRQQGATQQSATNLMRAKNTTLPNGSKADPAILDMLWQRLDPSVTASDEGAKQVLMVAMGYTQAVAPAAPPAQGQRNAQGQFTAPHAPPPPPLFTEKAGGKVDGNHLPLSPQELKYIKDSGMTEKDYLAATPPWMRK